MYNLSVTYTYGDPFMKFVRVSATLELKLLKS